MEGGLRHLARGLHLLLAATVAGAVAGVAVGLVLLIDQPLGPYASALNIIGLTALLGLLLAAPIALLCGGLLRVVIRAQALYGSTTLLFVAAGALAGAMFLPLFGLLIDGNGPQAFWDATLMTALAGASGALAYRLAMPPIRPRSPTPHPRSAADS